MRADLCEVPAIQLYSRWALLRDGLSFYNTTELPGDKLFDLLYIRRMLVPPCRQRSLSMLLRLYAPAVAMVRLKASLLNRPYLSKSDIDAHAHVWLIAVT